MGTPEGASRVTVTWHEIGAADDPELFVIADVQFVEQPVGDVRNVDAYAASWRADESVPVTMLRRVWYMFP
jgi:hypothetical protein